MVLGRGEGQVLLLEGTALQRRSVWGTLQLGRAVEREWVGDLACLGPGGSPMPGEGGGRQVGHNTV